MKDCDDCSRKKTVAVFLIAEVDLSVSENESIPQTNQMGLNGGSDSTNRC